MRIRRGVLSRALFHIVTHELDYVGMAGCSCSSLKITSSVEVITRSRFGR